MANSEGSRNTSTGWNGKPSESLMPNFAKPAWGEYEAWRTESPRLKTYGLRLRCADAEIIVTYKSQVQVAGSTFDQYTYFKFRLMK